MAMVKICPACDFPNPPQEMMCQECAALIADVSPAEAPDAAPSPEATLRQPQAPALVLCDEVGREIARFATDAELGRSCAGAEFFAGKPTVSRRHCRVFIGEDGWMIEDLGSLNGAWLNGARILRAERLRDGDVISLSRACSLRVKI